jgi:AcrR family transcriptional regulator
MARTDHSANNRDRILQAAERLFAEKGFDATSVGSIARAAGVNKALIYYYFESKDALLAALFESVSAEVRERASTVVPSELREKVAGEVAYLADRRRTLALLLMQALKGGDETPALFGVVGEMIERELIARGFPPPEDGSVSEEQQRALVHEFFTGVVPVVAFVTLGDRFCTYFDLDPKKGKTLFLDALEQSHFASHVEPPEDA